MAAMADEDAAAQLNKQFSLSTEIHGHEGPIRAVCCLQEKASVASLPADVAGNTYPIASGSQDATAKIWIPRRISNPATSTSSYYYENNATLASHDHWVVAIAEIPQRIQQKLTNGAVLLTGSLDKQIRLFDAAGTCQQVLKGHNGGAISFSWTANDMLMSGSWDGSARVWNLQTGECVITLANQENGVCVLGLPNGNMVTGSTGQQSGNGVVDFQMRLWSTDGKQLKSIRQHSGPVRSLDVVPSVGFMSTSNDGTVALWSNEGDALALMPHPITNEGQPSFVLYGCCLTTSSGGGGDGGVELVSVDESGVCMVWSGSEPLQKIEHPEGLWCVAALPNGDFVTGCQDHVLRVFTRHPDRVGPPDMLAAFDQSVRDAATRKAKGPSDVEIAKLPHWDHRFGKIGKSEGQVHMFQKDGKAIAAQWSSSSASWVEIGEVMGSSSKSMLDGVSYDHVFSIEVEAASGDVSKLEIGVNNGDNPFTAAQLFIDKHMLPQSYLREIADYISQRVASPGGPTLGIDTSGPGGFDGVGDPNARSAPPPSRPAGGGGGGGGSSHFPYTTYITFETGNLEKVVGKIQELKAAAMAAGKTADEDDGQPPSGVLSADDSSNLQSLTATLSATNRYHSSTVTAREVKLLKKLITNCPTADVFPRIDLCRLAVLHPHTAELLATGVDGTGLIQAISQKCVEGGDVLATALCSLRFFANILKPRLSRQLALGHAGEILDAVSNQVSNGNKIIQLSLASLLLNFAVALSSPKDGSSSMMVVDDIAVVQQVLAVMCELLGQDGIAEDVSYRVLVGIGTLISAGGPETDTALSTARELDIGSLAKGMATQAAEAQQAKVAAVATDVATLLL